MGHALLAILWLLMMVVWMCGLLFGAWWVWPHIQRLALTADLVFSLVWLIIGGAAWVVALGLGLQRYFRR